MANAALVHEGRKAQLGDQSPTATNAGSKRLPRRRIGNAVERRSYDVEECVMRLILRYAQRKLSERRRRCEAVEVERQDGTRAGDVEADEGRSEERRVGKECRL